MIIDKSNVDKYISGEQMKCTNQYVTRIDYIPDYITDLVCYGNELTELNLHEGLKWLDCSHNRLTKLNLPSSLTILVCNDNKLTDIGDLPPNLISIECDTNRLTKLNLNDNLEYLDCSHNGLIEISKCEKLDYLDCSYNELTKLNRYDKLKTLICNKNLLTELPILNEDLDYLVLHDNPVDMDMLEKIKGDDLKEQIQKYNKMINRKKVIKKIIKK